MTATEVRPPESPTGALPVIVSSTSPELKFSCVKPSFVLPGRPNELIRMG